MSLEFKCPKCGCDELIIVELGVVMSSKVIDIDEQGYFQYDLIDCGGGSTDCFKCFKCGYVLKDDEGGNLIMEEEAVEWIKKNCK